jgi:hypothetical protein
MKTEMAKTCLKEQTPHQLFLRLKSGKYLALVRGPADYEAQYQNVPSTTTLTLLDPSSAQAK